MEKKNNLVEIKRGQTGRGLLVEQDGYMSLDETTRKNINESIDKEGGWFCPNPFIVSAVFQKYGIENHNGRIYPEEILKREVEKYQVKIQEKRAYGECNHPDDSVIDLGRVCMNIVELHWEQHTLVGKIEIITSEAFRKSGLICCLGDTVANLLLSGLKIGVSSRAVGSVEQRFGKMIVGDDLELICWDVVSDPSTPGSFISTEPNGKDLQMYVEGDMTKEKKEKLFEKLENFNSWLE